MGVPQNDKMVGLRENLIKIIEHGWFGGTPILGNLYMFTLNIEKHMAQHSCSHEVITCFNAQGSQLRSFWIEPHSTHSSLLFYIPTAWQIEYFSLPDTRVRKLPSASHSKKHHKIEYQYRIFTNSHRTPPSWFYTCQFRACLCRKLLMIFEATGR